VQKRAKPTSSKYKNAARGLNIEPRGVKVKIPGTFHAGPGFFGTKPLIVNGKGYSHNKKEFEGKRD
jgi:hypothetical protein